MRYEPMVVIGRISKRSKEGANQQTADDKKPDCLQTGSRASAFTSAVSGLTLVAVDLFVTFLGFDAVLGGRADQ
jgi:hypothetical protein